MGDWFTSECERLADLYAVRFLEPIRRACPALDTDAWDSLKFFLIGYAFERQGRAQDYMPVAGDAIDECRSAPLSPESAGKAWRAFRSRLGDHGLNYSLNPLCPAGERYHRKYKGRTMESSTWQPSAVELAVTELKGEPIVSWTRRTMEDDRTAEAYNVLRRINGVSDKIVSFFLRDVAFIYRLALANQRDLLQPIDTWLRMVVREISGRANTEDYECARYVVEYTKEPEKANQGIWYFCSQVAFSSQYRVRQSMSDHGYMRDLIRYHLLSLVEMGKASSDFASSWRIDL